MITRGRYIDERASFFFNSISNELIDIQGQTVLYYSLIPEKSISTNNYKYTELYKESHKKKYSAPIRIPAIVDIDKKNTETFEDAKFERKINIRVSFNREKLKELNLVPMEGDIICFQRMFFEIYTVDDTEMHHGSPEFKYSINVEGHQIRIDPTQQILEFDNEL